MGLKEFTAEAKRIVKGEDEAGGRLSDPHKISQEVSLNPIQVLEPPKDPQDISDSAQTIQSLVQPPIRRRAQVTKHDHPSSRSPGP